MDIYSFLGDLSPVYVPKACFGVIYATDVPNNFPSQKHQKGNQWAIIVNLLLKNLSTNNAVVDTKTVGNIYYRSCKLSPEKEGL